MAGRVFSLVGDQSCPDGLQYPNFKASILERIDAQLLQYANGGSDVVGERPLSDTVPVACCQPCNVWMI